MVSKFLCRSSNKDGQTTAKLSSNGIYIELKVDQIIEFKYYLLSKLLNFDVISVLDFLILFSMKFEVIINKGDGSFHQNQTAVFEGSDFKILKSRKWTSFKESGFETLIHFGFTRKIVTWKIYSKKSILIHLQNLEIGRNIFLEVACFA